MRYKMIKLYMIQKRNLKVRAIYINQFAQKDCYGSTLRVIPQVRNAFWQTSIESFLSWTPCVRKRHAFESLMTTSWYVKCRVMSSANYSISARELLITRRRFAGICWMPHERRACAVCCRCRQAHSFTCNLFARCWQALTARRTIYAQVTATCGHIGVHDDHEAVGMLRSERALKQNDLLSAAKHCRGHPCKDIVQKHANHIWDVCAIAKYVRVAFGWVTHAAWSQQCTVWTVCVRVVWFGNIKRPKLYASCNERTPLTGWFLMSISHTVGIARNVLRCDDMQMPVNRWMPRLYRMLVAARLMLPLIIMCACFVLRIGNQNKCSIYGNEFILFIQYIRIDKLDCFLNMCARKWLNVQL